MSSIVIRDIKEHRELRDEEIGLIIGGGKPRLRSYVPIYIPESVRRRLEAILGSDGGPPPGGTILIP
jgi:hypothetical protein